MKIFALDCSSVCASTAIAQDGEVLFGNFQKTGLTHSETLMPMCAQCFEKTGLDIKDIDLFAVNAGPGSFTGVRIGVSTVKGLAFESNSPCTAVSTLLSMAYNFLGENVIVLGTMDARRNQIYTATFDVSGNVVTRLTDDEAVEINSIAERVRSYNKPVIVAGDAAEITYRALCGKCPGIKTAPEDKRYQNAAGVAAAAYFEKLETVKPADLMPTYIRLPQAVRELNSKGVKR